MNDGKEPNDKNTVAIAEAEKAVHDMTRRVALLHLAYARTLVDELGEERGNQLIKQAIWQYGSWIGEQTRRRVEELGLEPSVQNFSKGSDLSPLGFDNQPAVVDGEERTRAFGCVLAEVWDEHDERDLGGLYCLVDPAKMQAYDAGHTMVHTKRVPEGDPFCEFAIRPTDAGDDS